MTNEHDTSVDAQDLLDDVAEEPSIWAQKSDIDWLAPATKVSEYDKMLSEDCEDCEDCDLCIGDEDTS
jgi:hypothetical protein